MALPHILVIEDDQDVAGLIVAEMQHAGFTVECRNTAVQGLVAARERPPEAVILDLGLPDFDGRLVLARLRATTQVPIVVLTARQALAEKVDVLALGASDYIVKPFEPRELVARLHVQVRRPAPDTITVGDLTLHLPQGRATLGGQDLLLTRTELRLLALLANQPGTVFTPQALCAALWEVQPLSSNLLRVHVSHLRRKVELAGGTDVIRTVWGTGYALRATHSP